MVKFFAIGKMPRVLSRVPSRVEALGQKVLDPDKLSRSFDSKYYLLSNPDVEASGIDPLVHYAKFGIYENRAPNAIFDPSWYLDVVIQNPAGTHVSAYREFLKSGLEKGLPPSKLLLPVFCSNSNTGQISRTDYERLARACNSFFAKFGSQGLNFALAMFAPSTYSAKDIGSGGSSAILKLAHFLEKGAKRGIEPGPMFKSQVYISKLKERAERIPSGTSPFFHFLDHGISQRIVPNTLFNDEDYAASYADLSTLTIWPFEHFLFHGIFEGRRLDKGLRVIASIPARSHLEGMMNHWNIFWAEKDHSFAKNSLVQMHQRQAQVLRNLVASDIYADVTRKAANLEPSVGDFLGIKALAVPPFFDVRFQVLNSVKEMLQKKRYDSIVCVPWLRTGGADLVACHLVSALKALRPNDQILVLRTDHSHFERPDWLVADVEIVDISPNLKLISADQAEEVFQTLLLGLNPVRIFNVNSNLCWRVLSRFGRRLKQKMHLYSHLFCWDQLANGVRVGYPSMFFASTSPWLDGVLTDSNYLRNELIRIYGPPNEIKDKIVKLPTPLREPPLQTKKRVPSASGSGKRPLILWAGRLDRQKRFDLAIAIAKSIPEVDFACWGEALLDHPPKLDSLPANLTLRPNFKSYEELPLEEASLWLFTSAWEGIPTLLIELAFRNVPIVASAVGGVPELINSETGYPVNEIENVDAYVAAIRSALMDPTEAMRRAVRLHNLASTLHSNENFLDGLTHLLEKEKGNG